MQSQQQQNQNSNPQVQSWSSAMVAGQGIPQPSGTDENGQPYWIVNDRRISWQQMQQYIWQARQQVQAQMGSGGGGFESMPAMPSAQHFEHYGQPETSVETIKGLDRKIESPESGLETKAEQLGNQNTSTQAQNTKPEKPKMDSVLGQSAELKTVRADDLDSMKNFYQANNQNPGKGQDLADTYLAELFGKILRRLIYVGR